MTSTVPKNLRQLRACLSCSLIKTMEQFENDGCDNCESFLHLRDNRDNVYECTSSKFSGMIAACQMEDSWVAKWQRIRKFKPGVYAISVSGRLPKELENCLKNEGIIHKSRNKRTR